MHAVVDMSSRITTETYSDILRHSDIFVKFFFPKSAQNAIFGLPVQIFAGGAEILTTTRSFKWFGRTQKINLVDLKKNVDKFFETFF